MSRKPFLSKSSWMLTQLSLSLSPFLADVPYTFLLIPAHCLDSISIQHQRL
ncbi:MAG: hypothetical protein MRECE_13c033 [Mycoplasmataceae bacterium CE_OT135]|nr:MAG: hypothetical protein MRECE_13c033 [Mycoplasmataceae bacterium CE_OT135]